MMRSSDQIFHEFTNFSPCPTIWLMLRLLQQNSHWPSGLFYAPPRLLLFCFAYFIHSFIFALSFHSSFSQRPNLIRPFHLGHFRITSTVWCVPRDSAIKILPSSTNSSRTTRNQAGIVNVAVIHRCREGRDNDAGCERRDFGDGFKMKLKSSKRWEWNKRQGKKRAARMMESSLKRKRSEKNVHLLWKYYIYF